MRMGMGSVVGTEWIPIKRLNPLVAMSLSSHIMSLFPIFFIFYSYGPIW